MAFCSIFILLSCVVSVLAFELYNVHEHSACASKFGSDVRGCSLNCNDSCCSSMTKLGNDLKGSCRLLSNFVVIEMRSDLDLVSSYHSF